MSIARADVLVVGLGPAGACAAAAAARSGLAVIAVDRRHTPGVPVQCAEWVPALIEVDADTLTQSIRQSIESMHTFVEDDPADVMAPFRGHMLDRATFDAALAAGAERAGARCRFGASVRRIAKGEALLADGAIVRARVMIGADGPRSLVGRAIGSVNAELVETRQITVPLARPQASTDIFLSTSIRGGYGWLFPKSASANLGAGVAPDHRGDLKAIVAELHAMLIAQGRVGETVLATTGGAIPVGGMLDPCAMQGATHVLLAGDAAGLANPVTGAGIAAAVYSGALAGETAAALVAGDRDAARAYQDELRSVLGPSLARALKRRQELTRANGARDVKARLRRGWIAYPEYWAA